MTENRDIFISVIVPTCGRPDQLRLCLQAIRRNLVSIHDPVEIIVSDDSKDAGCLEDFSEFPQVRVIAGPRRGPAANRNKAASLATGTWLLFTDDDCIPSEKWISSFRKHFDEGWNVLEGKTVTDLPLRPLYTAPVNYSGGLLWSCNFAIRRSLFEALGGFDEKFPNAHMEDVDFRYRLQQMHERWLFVHEAEIFHPQRRMKSDIALPWQNVSNFYFCRKHGVSLSESGLSFRGLLTYHFQLFRNCRNVWQRLRVWRGLLLTLLFHLVLVPYWYIEYCIWPKE